jgi:hypothetical protein
MESLETIFFGMPVWGVEEFKKQIESYLKTGGNINDLFEGESLLYHAVAIRNRFFVDELLTHENINVNLGKDGTELTPLSLACVYGMQSIAELLLAHPSVDVNSPIASPPLSRCVQSASSPIFYMLLKHPNIDLFMENTPYDSKPWRILVKKSINAAYMDISQMIFESGKFDVRFLDSHEKTTLKNFLLVNDLININEILFKRPDVDINELFSHDGKLRPLIVLAIIKGNEKLLESLIKSPKINPNIMVDGKFVPLMFIDFKNFITAGIKRALSQFKLLLSNPNTDPDAVDNNGNTTMIRLISILSKLVLDANEYGEDHAAITKEKYGKHVLKAINMLIDAGGNPTIINNKGDTIETYGTNIPEIIVTIIEYYTKHLEKMKSKKN